MDPGFGLGRGRWRHRRHREYDGGTWGGVSLSPLGRGLQTPLPGIFFNLRILVHSRALLSMLNCFCTIVRSDLEYACPVWHSRLICGLIKGSLEFLQKKVLNIIFPGSEYATNLTVANVETLSYDDSDSHSFSLVAVSYLRSRACAIYYLRDHDVTRRC